MVYSIGIILIAGFLAGWLFSKIKLPGLVGMIIAGMIVGPYCLKIISPDLLNISSELRQIALVIILTRSGLNLDLKALKKVGRPAILMCFLPATFEIAGAALAGIWILKLSVFESLLLGSVLAAVSPAVVSPRMIKLIEDGYGRKHSVPDLVLAGSSADDIYTIVLFYAFLGLTKNDVMNFTSIALVPVEIILGILLGIIVGLLLSILLKHTNFHVAINILIILGCSFLMIGLEKLVENYVPVSSLLGIMVLGMVLLFLNKEKAKVISAGYNSMWKVFEIILFTLVGCALDFKYASHNFFPALGVLAIGLTFRTLGVFLCLIKTKLTWKERLFCVFSYLPKATVQASIGGIALASGLACGDIVLTVSVIAIIITAPIGAILIDTLGHKLLDHDGDDNNDNDDYKITEKPVTPNTNPKEKDLTIKLDSVTDIRMNDCHLEER